MDVSQFKLYMFLTPLKVRNEAWDIRTGRPEELLRLWNISITPLFPNVDIANHEQHFLENGTHVHVSVC